QLMSVPIPMARQIRKPTNKPEPKPSKLTLRPRRIGWPPGKNQFSRTHFKVVAVITAADAKVPRARALTGPADTPVSRPSCNTFAVSPGLKPTAVGKFFFIDIGRAIGHGKQNAKQAGVEKQEEDLPRPQVDGRIKSAASVEHVKGREQHRHESGLARACA